jgi:LCP family protein required for cell wall assembly
VSTVGTTATRSWAQRLLIGVNAVALVGAASAAGFLAYSNDRLADVDRLALSDVTQYDELEAGDPQNYLIVGVDDASGLDAGDSVRTGRDQGALTDTIMVLRVDLKAATADLVSFPRDLWVPIADTGAEQRINAAYATGGPERLIRTINENFGIPVHHYLQVDFAVFRKLVDVVGGVPVHFPRPARSEDAGLVIEEAGCWSLGPVQALGFSRARKDYQVQDSDGDWHTDLRGDHSRIERQQLFVELALRQAIAKGARNPNTMRRLVELAISDEGAKVQVDDSLDVGNIVDLGRQFRTFDPADLRTHTLPVTDGQEGEADILYLREEAAEPILSVFRGVGPAGSVLPEDVAVQVRNGTDVQGQARDVTTALADAGFDTYVPTDADSGGPTTILFAAGSEGAAQLVARHVDGPVVYEQVEEALDGADVVLVTGTDWVGVTTSARPVDEVPAPTTTTASTTTTTTAPTTTTTAPVEDEGTEAGSGAADDPDDPDFFRAEAPEPGMDCPRTG